MKLKEMRAIQLRHMDKNIQWLKHESIKYDAASKSDKLPDFVREASKNQSFVLSDIGSVMLYLMEQIDNLAWFIDNIGLTPEQMETFKAWNNLRFRYPDDTPIRLTEDLFMYPNSKGLTGTVNKTLLNGLLQCTIDKLGTVCIDPDGDAFEEMDLKEVYSNSELQNNE